jgi:hypothetical protein
MTPFPAPNRQLPFVGNPTRPQCRVVLRLAAPVADIFDTFPTNWSFTATPAAILYCTQLPLLSSNKTCKDPSPDAAYWKRVTRGMNFTDADLVDGETFNRVLWKGMMGNRPYPSRPTGKNLSHNRENLLANYRRSLERRTAKTGKPARN